jgi:hypothetical protein
MKLYGGLRRKGRYVKLLPFSTDSLNLLETATLKAFLNIIEGITNHLYGYKLYVLLYMSPSPTTGEGVLRIHIKGILNIQEDPWDQSPRFMNDDGINLSSKWCTWSDLDSGLALLQKMCVSGIAEIEELIFERNKKIRYNSELRDKLTTLLLREPGKKSQSRKDQICSLGRSNTSNNLKNGEDAIRLKVLRRLAIKHLAVPAELLRTSS